MKKLLFVLFFVPFVAIADVDFSHLKTAKLHALVNAGFEVKAATLSFLFLQDGESTYACFLGSVAAVIVTGQALSYSREDERKVKRIIATEWPTAECSNMGIRRK